MFFIKYNLFHTFRNTCLTTRRIPGLQRAQPHTTRLTGSDPRDTSAPPRSSTPCRRGPETWTANGAPSSTAFSSIRRPRDSRLASTRIRLADFWLRAISPSARRSTYTTGCWPSTRAILTKEFSSTSSSLRRRARVTCPNTKRNWRIGCTRGGGVKEALLLADFQKTCQSNKCNKAQKSLNPDYLSLILLL